MLTLKNIKMRKIQKEKPREQNLTNFGEIS